MKQHMMTHKLQNMPQHMFGGTSPHSSIVPPSPLDNQSHSPEQPLQQPQQQQPPPLPPKELLSVRIKSETELNSPSTDSSSRGSNVPNIDRIDRRERSLPPPPFQTEPTGFPMMIDRQAIKNEVRLKRSPTEIEQPSPKRSLGE